MFYSTLYCADVHNEHCVQKNTTGNTKICNRTVEDMSNREIRHLKQKLEISQYKIKKINENITYLKLRNQALSAAHNGLFGANTIGLEILLLVLIGLLLTSTVTFMILFCRAQRKGEKQQQKVYELTTSKDMIRTTVTTF